MSPQRPPPGPIISSCTAGQLHPAALPSVPLAAQPTAALQPSRRNLFYTNAGVIYGRATGRLMC